jgi:hypothetical protein
MQALNVGACLAEQAGNLKVARLHVRANYHCPKMAPAHLFPALSAMYLNNCLQRSVFLRCPLPAYRGSSLGARAAEQSLSDRHSISIELLTIRTGGRMTQLLKMFTHPAVKKPQHLSNEQTSLTSSAPLLSPISSKSSSPAINGRTHTMESSQSVESPQEQNLYSLPAELLLYIPFMGSHIFLSGLEGRMPPFQSFSRAVRGRENSMNSSGRASGSVALTEETEYVLLTKSTYLYVLGREFVV